MSATLAAAAAWRTLVERASASYRPAGRFALHFARGKLSWDPVFRHLLVHGLIAPRSRVLDIGCGQGLLASLLEAADDEARRGRWPAGWAPPPLEVRLTGIELSQREVARARDALGDSAEFVCGDMRNVAFPAADTVVILDVLHYVARREQDEVLARARAALGSGGRLLLRVGDAASRRRFATSQWVDRLVFLLRGCRSRPQAGRPVAEWTAHLVGLGFEVAGQPMAQGTPFANVLLIGTVAAPGTTS
ncbi:MAG: methyltransferase domain-containing protein [Burkholderiales bacterium]|nr:methyltransferase domain-containing protein [Burkholderiales bacterium]